MIREFREFLLKQNAIALAIGVVMGGAVGKLVTAVVEDFVMPIINPALSAAGADWRTFVLNAGPIKFTVGHLVGAAIDFSIIAFVIFMIGKALVKAPPPAAGPAMRECPACLEQIRAQAKRCKFCTEVVAA